MGRPLGVMLPEEAVCHSGRLVSAHLCIRCLPLSLHSTLYYLSVDVNSLGLIGRVPFDGRWHPSCGEFNPSLDAVASAVAAKLHLSQGPPLENPIVEVVIAPIAGCSCTFYQVVEGDLESRGCLSGLQSLGMVACTGSNAVRRFHGVLQPKMLV